MKEMFGKEKWKHLFYTVTHPSDGYYWIRHKDKGSIGIAVLLVLIFGIYPQPLIDIVQRAMPLM